MLEKCSICNKKPKVILSSDGEVELITCKTKGCQSLLSNIPFSGKDSMSLWNAFHREKKHFEVLRKRRKFIELIYFVGLSTLMIFSFFSILFLYYIFTQISL